MQIPSSSNLPTELYLLIVTQINDIHDLMNIRLLNKQLFDVVLDITDLRHVELVTGKHLKILSNVIRARVPLNHHVPIKCYEYLELTVAGKSWAEQVLPNLMSKAAELRVAKRIRDEEARIVAGTNSSVGPIGCTGDVGCTGATGLTGVIGCIGATGLTGPAGYGGRDILYSKWKLTEEEKLALFELILVSSNQTILLIHNKYESKEANKIVYRKEKLHVCRGMFDEECVAMIRNLGIIRDLTIEELPKQIKEVMELYP